VSCRDGVLASSGSNDVLGAPPEQSSKVVLYFPLPPPLALDPHRPRIGDHTGVKSTLDLCLGQVSVRGMDDERRSMNRRVRFRARHRRVLDVTRRCEGVSVRRGEGVGSELVQCLRRLGIMRERVVDRRRWVLVGDSIELLLRLMLLLLLEGEPLVDSCAQGVESAQECRRTQLPLPAVLLPDPLQPFPLPVVLTRKSHRRW
jgi:hypothetical protein